MAKYQVFFTKTALKDVKKLDAVIAKRIEKKIRYFIDSGKPLSFATQLTKPSDAQYRWKVGDYRILFDTDSDTITILLVQHRKDVYKK